MSKDDEPSKSEIIDNEIIEYLSEDGRISYRELGRKLERSPVTIKKHVEDLEEEGIIKSYGVQIDYEKLGYEIIALVELTIDKGKMLEVEQEIAKLPNIFAVYDITGSYDALIIARFKKRTELSEIVKIINANEFVVRTNTHLILNVLKEGTNFTDLLKYENEKKQK